MRELREPVHGARPAAQMGRPAAAELSTAEFDGNVSRRWAPRSEEAAVTPVLALLQRERQPL
jgi:hypothetical protein